MRLLADLLIAVTAALVGVNSFKISPRVDTTVEPEKIVSSQTLRTHQPLDPPYPDHATYEAVFAGNKKPLTVDCTQPGVVCKFPIVISGQSLKPAKQVKEVPIIKGTEPLSKRDNIEGREEMEEKEDIIELEHKVPIYKGSTILDVESISEKDIEDTWILEKNVLNKKFQIPVKLIPSKNQHRQGISPVYPSHHDFHDHFSGDSYHFPHERHASGWTPWMRAYPSVYNYPSHQPCQPPVYHYPPPCTSSVNPTKKPVINIDDKVDKDED